MREQNDRNDRAEDEEKVEDTDDGSDEGDEESEKPKKAKKPRARKASGVKPAKEKTPAKPRARKKTTKVPPRLFARWAVCDNAMKRIALFEYKDRAGADAKLVEIQEKKSGTFFIILIKEIFVPTEPEPVVAV